MDYLLLPGNEVPQVPHVATRKLSSDCRFADFPDKSSLSIDGYFDWRRSEGEILDYIQSWLYFGLIGEVTGREIDPTDHKSGDGERSTIELGQLRDVLRNMTGSSVSSSRRARRTSTWRPAESRTGDRPRRARSLSPPANRIAGESAVRSTESTRRRKALELATDSLERFEKSYANENGSARLDIIVLSIRVLVEFLSGRAMHAITEDGPMVPAAARALRRKMLKNRWCESQWYRVCRSCSLQTAMYLSMICRKTDTVINHSRCTKQLCKTWHTWHDGFSQHTTRQCNCAEITISGIELGSIIRRGKIPLLSMSVGRSQHLRLHLHAGGGFIPYTAFSSILPEGLGNHRSKGITECQLLRLKAIIDNIPSSVLSARNNLWDLALSKGKRLFWLDALCIPGENQRDVTSLTAIRHMAVEKVGTVYAKASPTVALDPEVEQLPKGTSTAEVLAHLAHGGWTSYNRALQWDALPQTLVFPLESGIFDATAYLTSVRRRSILMRSNTLTRVIQGRTADVAEDLTLTTDGFEAIKTKELEKELLKEWREWRTRFST